MRAAVFGDGGAEGGQHDRAGDRAVCRDVQGHPGVVVQPGDDLDVGAVGQGHVGEVGLPAFVGLVGFEPSVGALGLLGRGGDDPVVVGQDPGHAGSGDGYRGAGQVSADRLRAGVVPGGDQPVSFGQHGRHDRLGHGPWAGLGPPRPRFERGLALEAVAGHEPGHPGR